MKNFNFKFFLGFAYFKNFFIATFNIQMSRNLSFLLKLLSLNLNKPFSAFHLPFMGPFSVKPFKHRNPLKQSNLVLNF